MKHPMNDEEWRKFNDQMPKDWEELMHPTEEVHVPTPSDHQRDVVRGILARGMELLDAKGHDYAGKDSAFINFTLTGMILDWAVSRGLQQEDLAFVSFIATKLARLIELRGSGKTPKNEAIQDTCMDLANYAALWGGWILTKTKADWLNLIPKKPNTIPCKSAKEYEEWTEGEEGKYPDLDIEGAKEATGFVSMSEAPSGYSVKKLEEMGYRD